MIDMFESMMKGERTYPAAMIAAKTFWDKFFQTHAESNSLALQKAIDDAQIEFERALADVGLTRPFAKGIFALTCVGSLYNDGFDDHAFAERVLLFIATSGSLSIEVKGAATDVAKLYHLDLPEKRSLVA